MPLTPAEVHNVAFKKPPIGKRGYDEEEVDAFLDVVEVELSRLIDENSDLRARSGGATAVGAAGAPPELDSLREENQRLQSHVAELERAMRDSGDGAQQQVIELEQQLAETRRQLQEAQQALAQGPQPSGADDNAKAVGVLALAQQ